VLFIFELLNNQLLVLKVQVMAKDLGKEKKPRRREIDLEYPKWLWVDYKLQDAKFFVRSGSYQLKGWIPNQTLLMLMLP
jgi:hypothetical protein